MPTELVLEISSYLQRHDISALLRVSHRLASIMTPFLGRLGATAVDRRISRRSLLHWAAGTGRTALLRLVIHHGADMHTRDSSGNTAIHSAMLCGQSPTVTVLLENGADAENPNQDGWSPLHLAAITGNREIVGLLLDHGVDINARSGALYCKTALHCASLQGPCAVLQLLMERGVNLGTKDLIVMTAAETAILAGQMAVVQLVFGAESERHIRRTTVKLLRQFKAVREEISVVRRRIKLLMALETWAVQFQSSRDREKQNVFSTE